MAINEQKLRELIAAPPLVAATDEVRRHDKVFFLGGDLPGRETIEAIFECQAQSPAVLFHINFGEINTFHRGEELARLIKKNFNAYIVAKIDWPAPSHVIERAYGAGVDIIDIPLRVNDQGLSTERGLQREKRLAALEHAQSVFPKWGVVSTLVAGEEALCSTVSGIDLLFNIGVIPFVELSPRAYHYPLHELADVYRHLGKGWKTRKVSLQPLLPLVELLTPIAIPTPRSLIDSLFSKFHNKRLLASSDLRRVLRVRQVEDSFGSAGL